jgi:hypothetical protein
LNKNVAGNRTILIIKTMEPLEDIEVAFNMSPKIISKKKPMVIKKTSCRNNA